MIRIAIVENEKEQADIFESYAKRWAESNGQKCQITIFDDGIKLVNNYDSVYDVVFLDIAMPVLDGLKTAKFIREQDENVIIIFVTNMAHHAIQGYKVKALDFLVKPITYFDLSLELNKVKKIIQKSEMAFFCVNVAGTTKKIAQTDIQMIEILNHDVSLIEIGRAHV